MWSQHLITVIPGEVEAATQPRKLSGFNPVTELGHVTECLDSARHDKLFVTLGTDL
jgi:hypothetical protein